MNERLRLLGILLLLGIGWGSTQSLGKIATSTGHRYLGLIFWQLLVGVLVLGAMLAVRRGFFVPKPAHWRFALLIALIGTLIPNSTFYIAVVHLPGGIMSILISAVPLISFPIALALGADRFSLLRVAGLGFGLLGVALIALPDAALPSPAMAAWLPLALIGPLCYAIEGNVVARFGTAGLDAVQAMFLASAVGAAIALPLAIGSGQFINPLMPWGKAEMALVASSALHAVLYATYVWLAAHAGAVFATQTSYIVTGSGVLWAMLLLGERFSGWVWLALAAMLCGLALVQPRHRVVPQKA
jgi:drug/metabolite transporter (DMT)-like permease